MSGSSRRKATRKSSADRGQRDAEALRPAADVGTHRSAAPTRKSVAMRLVEHFYGKPVEVLLAELLERHDSVRTISSELGVSYPTVWRWLVQFRLSTPYMDQKGLNRPSGRLGRGYDAAHTVMVDPAEATTLVLPESIGRVHFPVGSLPPDTFVTPTLLSGPSHPTGSLCGIGPYVELHAAAAGTGVPVSTPFPAAYSLTLTYQERALLDAGIKPQQLGFYFLDPGTMTWMVDDSTFDAKNHTASVRLNHMTEFALLADVTPPTTSLQLDGSRSPDGAYVLPVSVTLTAQDAAPGSGVAMTYYQVVPHGQPTPSATLPGLWQLYQAPFALRDVGDWDIYAFSVDKADNVESRANLGRIRLVASLGT